MYCQERERRENETDLVLQNTFFFDFVQKIFRAS